MGKLEYLIKQQEMAYHNLLCYSRNYSMTIPKIGREEEWNKCKEECMVVEELISIVCGQPQDENGPCVIDGKIEVNWQEVLLAGRKVIND